jgi:thioredoxin
MTTNIYPVDKVKYITSLEEVPKTGKVVIDFFADWCGPCKKLAPSFSELSTQHTNISFLKVNTDKAEEVAKFYDISALPTLIFISNNNIISIVKGFDLNAIKKELEELNKESN